MADFILGATDTWCGFAPPRQVVATLHSGKGGSAKAIGSVSNASDTNEELEKSSFSFQA